MPRKKIVKLVFIGDRFYSESKTMMSSIYHEDGRRYDWGFVNINLRDGKTVKIRPATPLEMEHYEDLLAKTKVKHARMQASLDMEDDRSEGNGDRVYVDVRGDGGHDYIL